MATSRDLCSVLRQKAGIETLEMDEKPTKLRIIGRLQKNFSEHWKVVMHRLLTSEQNAAWKVDLSKKYFLRAGQLFYGWRVLFSGEALSDSYDEIIQLMQKAPAPTNIALEEVPLVGSSPNRNTRSNVGPVGSVAIGPLAAARKANGG